MNEEDKNAPYELTADDFADDDDTPWADPQIQLDYQAALGEFVVEFNRLDDTLNKVLTYALSKIERDRLAKQYIASQFSNRIDLIDLLGGSNVLGLGTAPIADLKAVVNIRNILVHAHFDQNPFDGSYTLIQKGRDSNLKTEAIRKWSQRVSDVTFKMRLFEARWMFGHVKVTPQRDDDTDGPE